MSSTTAAAAVVSLETLWASVAITALLCFTFGCYIRIAFVRSARRDNAAIFASSLPSTYSERHASPDLDERDVAHHHPPPPNTALHNIASSSLHDAAGGWGGAAPLDDDEYSEGFDAADIESMSAALQHEKSCVDDEISNRRVQKTMSVVASEPHVLEAIRNAISRSGSGSANSQRRHGAGAANASIRSFVLSQMSRGTKKRL